MQKRHEFMDMISRKVNEKISVQMEEMRTRLSIKSMSVCSRHMVKND